MSVQLTNQTTGRRTAQSYQGFGGNVAAGGTPMAANAAGGTVGAPRSAKGANKQSQIPVAVGVSHNASLDLVSSPAAQTPLTVMGQAGGNTPQQQQQQLGGGAPNESTPLASVQKQLPQFDLQFNALKQQTTAAAAEVVFGSSSQIAKDAPSANGQSTGRRATNGSSTNGAGGGGGAQEATAVVEKNGTGGKKQQQQVEAESKGEAKPARDSRDSLRSSGRTQKQSEELSKAPQGQAKEEKQSGERKTPQNLAGSASLVVEEQPLKGFDAAGTEDMEPLVLEPWDLDEIPVPPTQAAGSKSKPASKPASPSTRDNTSTKVVQKEAQKSSPAAAAPADAATSLPKDKEAPRTPTNAGSEFTIGRPLRSISGRRSTRPLTDIKLTHPRRSSELNDSVSSMNVTVGSDIYMECLQTPGSASRKRKDMTPPQASSQGDVMESPPKRARLDFSGLLGFVASPVTMIRNRLSRVNLQSPAANNSSSPPRSLVVEEEDASKVEATGAGTSTTTTGSEEVVTTAAMQTDEEKRNTAAATEAKDGKEAAVTTEEGSKTGDEASEQQQQQSSSAAESADSEEDAVEVKIVTDQPKKMCNVM